MFKDKQSATRLVVIFSCMSMLAGLVSAVISALSNPSREALLSGGAGGGFITGAILIGAGLIALSNIAPSLKDPE